MPLSARLGEAIQTNTVGLFAPGRYPDRKKKTACHEASR
jgi:hypothetical protein